MYCTAPPKRAKLQGTPSRPIVKTTTSQPTWLCARCAHSTRVTLGELVRFAYDKNQDMRKAAEVTPLRRVVLQRALWARLRTTFFAPGVDSDALAEGPALAQHERLAYPCQCRQPNPLPRTAAPSTPPCMTPSHQPSLPPSCSNTRRCPGVVTPAKKHPLATTQSLSNSRRRLLSSP